MYIYIYIYIYIYTKVSRTPSELPELPGLPELQSSELRANMPPKTPYSRSKPLVRSKWLLEHAPERSERSHGCSGMLLIPRSLKMAARTCFCPPLTSKMVAREYAQTRLCAQNGCSSMLQSAQDAHAQSSQRQPAKDVHAKSLAQKESNHEISHKKDHSGPRSLCT